MIFRSPRLLGLASTLCAVSACASPESDALALSTTSSAVVQGSLADIADFPATVAFLDTRNANAVFCTGSLIGPRHVLSAAHCMANLVSTPTRVKVAAGSADVSQASALIDVEKIVVHPQWTGFPRSGDADGLDITNDVSVITLASDVPNTQVAYVLPDARIETDLPLRASLEIVGFGKDDAGKRGVLRRGTAPLRKRTAQLLLAGELGSADSCEYDSGGPLYLTAADGLYLVGLTSREWPGATQLSCGEGGVYTMPMAYRAFIEAELGTTLPVGMGAKPSDAGTPIATRDAGLQDDAGETLPLDSGTDVAPGAAQPDEDGGAGGCSVATTNRALPAWFLLLLTACLRRRRRS